MSEEIDYIEQGRTAFIEESTELLRKSEATLLRLETDPGSDDLINDLLRTVHTIKGSAAVLGFDEVVSFAHVAESVMGRLRDKVLFLDETLLSLLLESRDQIALLVGQVIDNPGLPLPDDRRRQGDVLLARLQIYLDDDSATGPQAPGRTTAANADAQSAAGEDTARVGSDNWHISVRFARRAFANGTDPLSIFQYLARVGNIVSMTTLSNDLPRLGEMNPEEGYLGFEIDFESGAGKDAIADVFAFVMDDCQLHILPPREKLAAYRELIDALPEENMAIGEILVASGALTLAERDRALRIQADQTVTRSIDSEAGETIEEIVSRPRLGRVVVEKGMTDNCVVDAAVCKQARVEEARKAGQQTVRVNAGKLGELNDLVGELLVASAQTGLKARESRQAELIEAAEQLARLVAEIRDLSLGLRMVQIGETFARFKRVVRDISKGLRKQVELKISGAETELDKALVEKISDPLMHLVRNALDHGIESPEVRVASGKPEKACLSLLAYQDADNVVIEISDDGKGLDPELILARAIDNGLVGANQQLSRNQIERLIFAPGFSTASEVTPISGRGVGMDVVNWNIDALRGQIAVSSEVGAGTTFTIRLPLTLVDGNRAQAGDARQATAPDIV